jgi:hypothetical protein
MDVANDRRVQFSAFDFLFHLRAQIDRTPIAIFIVRWGRGFASLTQHRDTQIRLGAHVDHDNLSIRPPE